MLRFHYFNSILVTFYLILIVLIRKNVTALGISSQAPEFRKHSLVLPILHHARTNREITSTIYKDGVHHQEVTMTINIEETKFILDLQLNEHLIPSNHVIIYQKNGKMMTHRPEKQELDICQYSGKVRDKKGSWVAVSTCDGVRGIIHDGRTMRYIQPADSNEISGYHYVYDHSDLNSTFHCGDDRLVKMYNDKTNEYHTRKNRYKRDTYEDTEVRGPFNVNKLSRFVELVLVADYREFRANGESKETVHRQLKDVANIINSLYSPLNIFISLVGVVVWNEKDEIVLDEDGDNTLKNFLRYRKQTHSMIPNDHAHLLTHQRFIDGIMGKTIKGSICTYEYSGGISTTHSDLIGLTATMVAHQLGHSLGLEHDTEECECSDERCVMSSEISGQYKGYLRARTPTKWSSCSERDLSLAFKQGKDYCLRNRPVKLFEPSTCGNGFIEPGEQCDCGLAGDPACTACCHPRACVLRSNATCAAGECCDTTTCRPKPAGSVCRAADKECDLPEYCSGHSEYCPIDVYKMDATPCGGGKAYCVGGDCRSHEDQCRLLWGVTGEKADNYCYTALNTKGDRGGNCGYSLQDTASYVKCFKEDALCGLLHCKNHNYNLEFGKEGAVISSTVFAQNNGSHITCLTAKIDLGINDPNPSFVPDGAKCGQEKMCLNHKCVPITEVTSEIARKETSVCPSDCSGHGVCNSKGHCHCEPGFTPPLCTPAHPGGSVDSGPPPYF